MLTGQVDEGKQSTTLALDLFSEQETNFPMVSHQNLGFLFLNSLYFFLNNTSKAIKILHANYIFRKF